MVLLQFLYSQPLLSGHKRELDVMVAAIHDQMCCSMYCCEERERLLDRIAQAICHSLRDPFKYSLVTKDQVDHHHCKRDGPSEVDVSSFTHDDTDLEKLLGMCVFGDVITVK